MRNIVFLFVKSCSLAESYRPIGAQPLSWLIFPPRTWRQYVPPNFVTFLSDYTESHPKIYYSSVPKQDYNLQEYLQQLWTCAQQSLNAWKWRGYFLLAFTRVDKISKGGKTLVPNSHLQGPSVALPVHPDISPTCSLHRHVSCLSEPMTLHWRWLISRSAFASLFITKLFW
jgi:hypothetical protein